MISQLLFEKHQCCVLIPTYNNITTLKTVLERVLTHTSHVIVVNDGSTDGTFEILESYGERIKWVNYTKNRGKGYALRLGFKKALQLGYRYALTLDSDGQHFPEDMSKFLHLLEQSVDPVLILGNRNMESEGIPAKSSFGNRFSNFWFWVETGLKQPDTQTGFRLYPIHAYQHSRFFTRKFEFEIEVLVRSAWSDISIRTVPIGVKYFAGEERVSHFRPFKDFSRISVLNTVLVLITFLWIKPRNFVLYFTRNNPKKIFLEQLKANNQSDNKIASALGFGIFMGIMPLWGLQMIIAYFVAHWLKLNKVLVILAANISIPPAIPFIVYGSYKMGGWLLQNPYSKIDLSAFKYLSNGDFNRFFTEMGYNIYQYLLGAFALAVFSSLLTYFLSLVLIRIFKRRSTGQI